MVGCGQVFTTDEIIDKSWHYPVGSYQYQYNYSDMDHYCCGEQYTDEENSQTVLCRDCALKIGALW